ncbi:MAG: hypothetical protein J1F11_04510 [Oscillospiraceae bacterium]|nr:hypothetical protein [Oscillospiraceae bacterium]
MAENSRIHINGYYNNTRIMNYIRDTANDPDRVKEYTADGEKCRLKISRRGSSEVYVSFRLSETLSLMDCVILDAAAAFFMAGSTDAGAWYKEFSAADMAEFIYGSKKARRKHKDIDMILEKLCRTNITIDISSELKMHMGAMKNDSDKRNYARNVTSMKNYREAKDGRRLIEGPLLSLEKTDRHKYRIAAPPPLYEYASAVNQQFVLYSCKLLDEVVGSSSEDSRTYHRKENGAAVRKKSTWNTARVLLIRYYLIGRLIVLNNFLRNRKRAESDGNDKEAMEYSARFKSYNEIRFSIIGRSGEILRGLEWDSKTIESWRKPNNKGLSGHRAEVFEEAVRVLEHFKSIGCLTGEGYKTEGSGSETVIEITGGINNPLSPDIALNVDNTGIEEQ